MIFMSWEYREVPVDWKMVNIVFISKKGKKEDPGDCRPVSLTLVSGKIMEKENTGQYCKTPRRQESCWLLCFHVGTVRLVEHVFLLQQGRSDS